MNTPMDHPGDYVLTTGRYRRSTLAEVDRMGRRAYLAFLRDSTASKREVRAAVAAGDCRPD